jgi:hypothetical protein
VGAVIADYDSGTAGLDWAAGLEATVRLSAALGQAISPGPHDRTGTAAPALDPEGAENLCQLGICAKEGVGSVTALVARGRCSVGGCATIFGLWA